MVYQRAKAILVVVVAALLLGAVGAALSFSSRQPREPMVVPIQTLVNAYDNPQDARCSGQIPPYCPSEDALYKGKLIETTGVTEQAGIWTGVAWDSRAQEYVVALQDPNGYGFLSAYFSSDAGVTAGSFGPDWTLTVEGTFEGEELNLNGGYWLFIEGAKVVSAEPPGTPSNYSATQAASSSNQFGGYAEVLSESFNGTELFFGVEWLSSIYFPVSYQLSSSTMDSANSGPCAIGQQAVSQGQDIGLAFHISPASAIIDSANLLITVRSAATGGESTFSYSVSALSATNGPIPYTPYTCA
ncbi:MAG: hypothetical protein JRN06_09095 [Nitrososphaerota archaeon]|nr:hypothetical protein [Nitrososphaerota archaeon]MDG7024741.1 hypothetical protein [Nitrososphaerota archaeon]